MFDLLEDYDGMAQLRNSLQVLADDRGYWAGIPMQLSNHHLIVHPSYPGAAGLAEINRPEPELMPEGVRQRNMWWSSRLRADVVVWEEGGKIVGCPVPRESRLSMDLDTLDCSDAWGIEQEHNALQLLGTLIRHRQMKQYLLTGMFLETSKRSGVTYVFRKLKPTVAIKVPAGSKNFKILAALCMHPIAYYAGTWAGAMTPTDDVIAHLMLMRGDEHLFWKRSNQHQPDRPQAGL